MSEAPAPLDPVELLSTLTAAALRERLEALDAECRALRVLWRAAQRRERALSRRAAKRPEEASRA
jgi:hypothetical protein